MAKKVWIIVELISYKGSDSMAVATQGTSGKMWIRATVVAIS